jgi:predicted nucleic acid-binding protein
VALTALRDLEVQELRFPADTASRLAQLRVGTGLTMPDCCALLAAEDAGASIASFDERLAQAGESREMPVVRR